MTSPYIAIDSGLRRRGHAPVVALLLAVGAMSAGAQQQVEIKVRSTRAENDSSQMQFRRLQRTLDSLTRVYNESEDLSASDRRRVETGLKTAVARMEALVDRMNAELGQRAVRPGDVVRLRMAPTMAASAGAAMSRELMQVQEMDAAMPRGWIGIVTQGAGTVPRIEGGQLLVRYFSYPRIVSVDPSSPAERAGIVANDTLVGYDGRDIREHELSITRLLRPNARVVVSVRRDGRVRDFPLTVANAPARVAQRRDDEVRLPQEPWVVSGVPEAAMFPRAPMPTPSAAGGMRIARATSMTPPAPSGATGAIAPMPPQSTFVYSFSSGGVAGAQLANISEGLARTVGVSNGVLVTSSPVGSVAHESGIMDGDVIIRVSGQNVRNVGQVRELVRLAVEDGERSVDVELLRQKKTVRVQLKW